MIICFEVKPQKCGSLFNSGDTYGQIGIRFNQLALKVLTAPKKRTDNGSHTV